jgi:hypothetical protein
MDKEVYFDIVREYTKEPPQEKTKWASESTLCMMFMEFRHIDTIKQNLWNIANVYGGGDTALVIVHSGDNRDIIMDTTKGWENVRYEQMYEHNVTKEVADYICIDHTFWEKFLDFEYVLMNTWDSYIFKRIPDMFFKYDIVGGLVAHYYIQIDGRIMNICSDDCKCPRCLQGEHQFKAKNFINYPNKGYVYCGGFFFRNVKTSIDLCKRKPWGGEPDDVYFSLSDLKKPTREDACKFAVNHFKHPDPIGCHQVWVHDEEFVRSLFK